MSFAITLAGALVVNTTVVRVSANCCRKLGDVFMVRTAVRLWTTRTCVSSSETIAVVTVSSTSNVNGSSLVSTSEGPLAF